MVVSCAERSTRLTAKQPAYESCLRSRPFLQFSQCVVKQIQLGAIEVVDSRHVKKRNSTCGVKRKVLENVVAQVEAKERKCVMSEREAYNASSNIHVLE